MPDDLSITARAWWISFSRRLIRRSIRLCGRLVSANAFAFAMRSMCFALARVSRKLCAGPDAAFAAALVRDLVLWAGGDVG